MNQCVIDDNNEELNNTSRIKKHEDNDAQFINDGQGDEMEVIGYEKSKEKSLLTFIGYVLTLGALRLIYHWYPHLRLFSTHKRSPLKTAQKVLVIHRYQQKFKTHFVKKIKIKICDNSTNNLNGDKKSRLIENNFNYILEDGIPRENPKLRAFWVKKLCYIWDEETQKFMKLIGLDQGITNKQFHNYKGFSEDEQNLRRTTYGSNEIKVPVQSILTLLVLEALNPFYIFQVFTLAVWLAEFYYYYTIAIIIMSVFGITSSIIQTRKNQMNLKSTVETMEKVRICRGDDILEDVPSGALVPGDLLLIPAHGCTMHCDAVLLEGNCIVNESMLTGESVPVTKTPLTKTNAFYNVKDDANHTLFCGTKVIQTRFYGNKDVRAVVIRTGYLTTKGQLVRSILYPPPADFKFDRDSYKFIGILGIIAFFGFLYTVISKGSRGISAGDIIIKALDIITIVVPPALPAAMTVGKLYAINRLKKKRIFCMNSRVINVTGSINCVCFDKTGTLTEDGLDMWGVVPVENNNFESAVMNVKKLPNDSQLLFGMACCHSLTHIDGNLFGDPLDIKMFESTGWILQEPDVEDTSKYDLLVPTIVKTNSKVDDPQMTTEIGIIKQYQFSSTLQRMSVITKTLTSDNFEVYCKGSPEMIISLSKPETVPYNIQETLESYTSLGYRVIALSHRSLPPTPYVKLIKLPRESIEKDLSFCGLVVLENQLKPETTPVISELREADVKCVMVTGDNIHTALSVARECGLVKGRIIEVGVGDLGVFFTDNGMSNVQKSWSKTGNLENGFEKDDFHLALNGSTWAVLKEKFPELLPRIVAKGTVFARMSGEQKQQLVLELQNLGYYVAMCGDGANDCGALKAAHTGISLSEAESSVASPFTSGDVNIRCVPSVIREGRAALSTSFGVFKFMVAYALTEFTSVIILYGIDTNLTDMQFLFIDICLVVNFATFFGRTEANKGKMVNVPPTSSLLGTTPLVSLVVFMIVAIIFQYFAFYFIQTFPWFEPFQFNEKNTIYYVSYENYAVYSISLFQYIGMTIVFSKGLPYRMPIYTNISLTCSLVLMTLVCSYIVLYPADWVVKVLELRMPPTYDIKITLIAMGSVNFVICLFLETFLVDFLVHKKIRPMFHNVEKSRKIYLKIGRDIRNENWPKIENVKNISLGYIDEKDEHFITRL